jgi:hypothetical protein
MSSAVYWIAHKDHTDMFSQGYIGVSNNHKKRWYSHSWKAENPHFFNAIKKYGWENLEKKVVLIAEDDYCLDIEKKIRPKNNIGWNIAIGGGKPPSALGKKFGPMSEATKAKVSASKKGFKHKPEVEAKVTQNLLIQGVPTRFKKGQVAWNKGKPMPPHVTEAVVKANTGRVHSIEERQKRSESMKGRIVSEETRQKIRLGNLGKKAPMTGKHFEKIQCPHCNKIGGLTAMPRWHFDNCKAKEIQ